MEPSPAQLAAGAEQTCQKLAKQFDQLIGTIGFRAIFERSLALSRPKHPWLPLLDPSGAGAPWLAVRRAIEQQEPAAGINGFCAVLAAFLNLLRRMIGDGLVFRLMHDVWPGAFAPAGPAEIP